MTGKTTLVNRHAVDHLRDSPKVTGSPEFLAVSVDGRRLCAASDEEYDYWVVLHEFS